jgi:hemoglobin-like flavoprotein
MLDQDTKQLLKDSLALLPVDTVAAAQLFYQRLFELAPEARAMFSTDMNVQAKKLITMLVWIAEHLDRPEELLRALHDLGARHAKYKTHVDHYAPVGSALLWMLQQTLGDKFTPDMEDAWITAYTFISTEMERGQRDAEVL